MVLSKAHVIIGLVSLFLVSVVVIPVAVTQSNKRSTNASSISGGEENAIFSDFPSLTPSDAPSMIPAISDQPSDAPSMIPARSDQPSDVPSLAPSDVPSLVPSDMPSLVPSDMPSLVPSDAPSLVPSDYPSLTPQSWTEAPTPGLRETTKSDHPSLVPSTGATQGPTGEAQQLASDETRRFRRRLNARQDRQA
jgi:hypothetical protein